MAESDLLKILSPLGRGRRAHARRVRGFERFKLNRRCHELKHSIDIREYVVVPKAKHQIPHRFQSLRSLRVGGDALSMLPPSTSIMSFASAQTKSTTNRS